jgi:membrane protein DedA with SNARE-associated domain
MMNLLVTYLTNFTGAIGYKGIFVLMATESMIFPVPSEAVMPFAGFLLAQGKMHLGVIIIWSTLGSLFGSLISYAMGYYGGRPFAIKCGKYCLLDEKHLIATEGFFNKHGGKTIFFGRFIPVVRHIISIPAGLGKMNIFKFCLYTLLGASIWNTILTLTGFYLGNQWEKIAQYGATLDKFFIILIILALVFIIYKKRDSIKRFRKRTK